MDWIDLFLEYSEGIPSPDIYRLWAGISTIAGALERRVWARTGRGQIFPNLYVLLIGPPGVGKSQAINYTRDLWRCVRELYTAPDNVTKASLVDVVARSQRRLMVQGQLQDYHSLLIPSTEFGVLVPSHDLEFLNVLNKLFDNEPYYREERRHLKDKQIDITNPQINLIAGTQPGYLAELLPEAAWTLGFMTRMIMVYAGTPAKIDLFHEDPYKNTLQPILAERLRDIAKLWGEMMWLPETKDLVSRWIKDGLEPVPEHSKLVHYNTRRILHTIKLSMVAAVSATGKLVIRPEDFARGRDWLLHAEALMPDIFREMVQKSDASVIQELHMFVWQIWAKDQKPVHESRLYHFLHTRVPSEKVPRLMELAQRSNILKRSAGTDCYVPRPKHEHGLE